MSNYRKLAACSISSELGRILFIRRVFYSQTQDFFNTGLVNIYFSLFLRVLVDGGAWPEAVVIVIVIVIAEFPPSTFLCPAMPFVRVILRTLPTFRGSKVGVSPRNKIVINDLTESRIGPNGLPNLHKLAAKRALGLTIEHYAYQAVVWRFFFLPRHRYT